MLCCAPYWVLCCAWSQEQRIELQNTNQSAFESGKMALCILLLLMSAVCGEYAVGDLSLLMRIDNDLIWAASDNISLRRCISARLVSNTQV